jgi:hypothetical protein
MKRLYSMALEPIGRSRVASLAAVRALLLALVFIGATCASIAEVLISDEGTSGDLYYRGFYIPKYPGTNLQSVQLEFSVNTIGTYVLGLTVHGGSYGSRLLIGTASEKVTFFGLKDMTKTVTFDFPSPRIKKGTTVCFTITSAGPSSQVYYSVPAFVGGNTNIIQTEATTSPLDTFRRYGVKVKIIGQGGLTVDPGDSIQAAINRASPGDTVLVKPGNYQEDITLRDNVSVVGSGFKSTFLRGTGDGNVVTASGVTNARLEGIKISQSRADHNYAGISVTGGDLLINNNWIYGNANGIRLLNGNSSIIRNNIIEGNGNLTDGYLDYGIICNHATPLIANNLVISNNGCAIYLVWSNSTGAQVINNTIVDNHDEGVWCNEDANVIIKNNIMTGNMTGISASYGAAPEISFNNVWQNRWHDYDSQSTGVATPGPGDISADPRFSTLALSVPFSLLERSPSINAGDPDPLYNDYDGTRNDQGAYGGPTGFRPEMLSPVNSGFLFNNIGRIPTSEITQSGDHRGLANVSDQVANDLLIYKFTDAPFGGALWLHGLFGFNDTNAIYYKIFGAPWQGTTRPAASDLQPLLDPLSKIKYTISSSGRVTATSVAVGPDANGFYLRTSSGYWAFPDLMLILNSPRLPNGLYDITCKAYDSNHNLVNLPDNDLTRITLWIDNSAVRAEIVSVTDPQNHKLEECDIVHLATARDPLKFEVIAYHPNGFLRNYFLDARYGRNRNAGNIVADQYIGAHATAGISWSGPNPQVFNSADAPPTQLADWVDCAYQFHLEAWARTTDGYNHIYAAVFDDHYSLYQGQGTTVVASPDLNGDGVVDGADVAIFATYFGRTNVVKTPTVK